MEKKKVECKNQGENARRGVQESNKEMWILMSCILVPPCGSQWYNIFKTTTFYRAAAALCRFLW